jgi:prefoldin subunit 5
VALLLIAGWLAIGPSRASAQFVTPPYPGTALPFLQGPDLVSTLRNGAQMASDQSRSTAQFAKDLSQRARSVGYQMQNLGTDYQNLEFQFQSLRATFNALGQLAQQLQTPRAANAVAELEAGLNIIAEAFIPVQQEMQANVLNRDSVVRMGQVMNEALLVWQKELKKCSSRLGMIQ